MRTSHSSQRRRGIAGSCILVALILHACTSTAELDRRLETALQESVVGNHTNAAVAYRGVLADFPESAEARLGAAVSLYRLGEYGEALRALSELSIDDLEPAQRSRALLHQAHAERQLGRQEEPVRLDDGSHDAERKTAGDHYLAAVALYKKVLEAEPRDLDAGKGLGECRLRLAWVLGNRQPLDEAGKLLQAAVDAAPDDKEALFFLGRAMQLKLGDAELEEEAATLMLRALEADRQENYDFHIAYRDVLSMVQKYPKRPVLLAELEGDKSRREKFERLIFLLDEYAQAGRHSDGPWETRLVASIHEFLAVYKSWDQLHDEFRDHLARAARIARDPDQGYALDRYRQAMELLDAVAAEFQSDAEYVDVRRRIQSVYVGLLLTRAQALGEYDQFARAKELVRSALDRCGQKVFIDENEEKEFLRREASISDGLRDAEVLLGYRTRVRDHMTRGRFDAALAEIERLRTEDRPFPRDVVDAFVAEVHKIQRTDALKTLSETYQRARDEADPAQAVTSLSDARRIATEQDLAFWGDLIDRELARRHFQLADYAASLDAIRAVHAREHADVRDLELRLLAVKCHFRQEQYDRACEQLQLIRDPDEIVAAADLEAAGLSYVRATTGRSLDRARALLERAIRAAPDDVDVRQGLTTCYRELYASLANVGTNRELIDILDRLTQLDPTNYESRWELGQRIYELAERRRDKETYAEAYAHLWEAYTHGVGPRNANEQERLGILIACYRDFAPLGENHFWQYRTSDGGTRDVKVEKKEGQWRYLVRVNSDEAWTWAVEDDLLARRYPSRGFREDFPVKLRWPGHRPAFAYKVLATEYKAEVVETGVSCEAGGATYSNCLHLRVTSDNSRRDFWFAPGVGEVRMTSPGFTYELVQTNVDDGSEA